MGLQHQFYQRASGFEDGYKYPPVDMDSNMVKGDINEDDG